MTRVIITGAGSYIGTHLGAWLSRRPERFEVEEMDLHGAWDASAFLGCGCVIHVAGLAHRREQPGDEALYDRVNRELAVEVARKEGAVQTGDTVVITAGVPIGGSGTTNLIKAQVVR